MNSSPLKSLFAERSEEIAEFAGYTAVSGGALCVDFTVYWWLLPGVKFAFAAAIGGYICGVLFHYMLSSRVVFRDRLIARGVIAEAPTIARFFAAGAIGLVVTTIVVGLLSDMLGVYPLIAKVTASGCSFTAVFLNLRPLLFNPAVSDIRTAT